MKTKLKPPYNIFFGTLANQHRIEIMLLLLKGPKNISHMSEVLKIHQSTVSKNIKRLELCGFVHCNHAGKETVCNLNAKTIKPLIKLMHTHVNTYCKYLGGGHDGSHC